MKKRVLPILLLLVIVIILPTIIAEDNLPPEIKKVSKVGEKITERDTEYLKQEWGKILEKNPFFGPIISNYNKISPYTDPIFKYTIGMPPSLSWLFALTIVLWIAFIIYSFRLLTLAPVLSDTAQKLVAMGLILIFSVLGFIQKIAVFIIDLISKTDSWKIQLFSVVAIIIALIAVSIFSKQLQELAEGLKKEKEDTKRDIATKKIEALADALD